MSMPLEGIRVLDFSMFLSGPRASQILADYGAEVVKVEPPGGETMRMWMMLIPDQEDSMTHWHRSKKGVTLDIRKPEGADMVKKMLPCFDILIENLAPGTMEKCGLGYDDLKEEFPGLIYCSISGFGKDSPCSHRVAFDIIAQATGGIMHANKSPQRSPGVFFGDLVSGAYAANGIMMALRHCDRTGEGQLVDVSMQDVMYFHNFRAFQVRMHKNLEEVREALGGSFEDLFTSEPGLPFWRPYPAKDGYVAVVFLTDRQWQIMCDIIGRPEYKEDPRFDNLINRVKNREVIREEIDHWMSQRTAAEIEKILDEHRIPCGRVLTTEEVNKDENLQARDMIAAVDAGEGREIPLPGIPVKLSKSPGGIRDKGPELGRDNAEVYSEYLGLSEAELKELKDKGVI